MSISEAQREFVHRYMDADAVVGVRVARLDGRLVLLVQIDGDAPSGLPETFQGFPIVIRHAPRPVLAYSQTALLQPGCWIYADSAAIYGDSRWVPHGSFGLIVRDLEPREDDDDDRLILTAAHLVTGIEDEAPMLFGEPGPKPGSAGTPCGKVRRRVPLQNLPYIAVDAAVIKPYPNVLGSNEMSCGMPNGVRDLFVLEEHEREVPVSVTKHGAESGPTSGELLPFTSDLKLENVNIRYTGGWDVYCPDGEAFAKPGDSGAVVVDAHKQVLGMLVAVDKADGRAFIHGIKQICVALNITFP